MSHPAIDAFISLHYLPSKFRRLIDAHYLPLASWLMRKRVAGKTLFLGINGAQGTGKSTLADFLKLALELGAGWHVAVLSLDDFYLPPAEREALGERVHPLLKTRGVPGTHDLGMLSACIESLKNLQTDERLPLPRFDKAQDDRAGSELWPDIGGPVDLIILEGWCVGSAPQTDDALLQPINPLEAEQDASGAWRRFVNEQLAGDYAELFAQIDALVFLRAPNFEIVYRWRLEQEEQLATASAGNGSGIMNKQQLDHFIQHYERITRANMLALAESADVVLALDEKHDCVQSSYPSTPE